jgi:hypothetical protein
LYDSKYNFSGIIINNTANVAQDSLNSYYLTSAAAVTYKDLTTLSTEAGVALASDPGLSWNDFYNNPANKVSIDNLSNADSTTLKNIFKKKDIINEERNRIDGLMDMQTWLSFTSGRIAYSGVILSDIDKDGLQQRFQARMMTLKGFFFQSLSNYVQNSLADPDTAWGNFRTVQGLVARNYEYSGTKYVIISESEIQNFKISVFDPRIKLLKANMSVAPAA